MFCPGCLENFSAKLAHCPRCRQTLVVRSAENGERFARSLNIPALAGVAVAEKIADSKVLEFPDARPQWRQEVSARLREFQTRRDGRAESAPLPSPRAERRELAVAPVTEPATPGVVSLAQRKELDPLVVKALQRIERAHQNMKAAANAHSATATAAVMRLAEPSAEIEPERAPAPPIAEIAPPVAPKPPILKVVETRRPVLPAASVTVAPLLPSVPDLPSRRPPFSLRQTLENVRDRGSAVYASLRVMAEPETALPEKIAEISAAAGAPLAFAPQVEESLTIEEFAPENFADEHESWDDEVVAYEAAAPFAEVAETSETPAAPRRVCLGVIDEAFLERQEAARAQAIQEKRKQIALEQGLYDDFAPFANRAASAVVDWSLALLASLPLLLLAGWTEPSWSWGQMFALMLFSAALFMALYSTILIYYTGRTWGQDTFFLSVAHVEDGQTPTLGQCAARSLIYLLWPVTLGAGLLYALWDAEGRTLHDKISGTIVLRS